MPRSRERDPDDGPLMGLPMLADSHTLGPHLRATKRWRKLNPCPVRFDPGGGGQSIPCDARTHVRRCGEPFFHGSLTFTRVSSFFAFGRAFRTPPRGCGKLGISLQELPEYRWE